MAENAKGAKLLSTIKVILGYTEISNMAWID